MEYIVPGICLSGFVVVSCWFFAVKSVKKNVLIINLKTPQNKYYFWPLLFGILILPVMYVFEFQTERKTWTIGGI